MACGVEPTVVELRNVDTGEIDDGELEVGRTVLSLGLVTGQPLTLDFGAHAHAAARFERELREAVAGAVTNAPPVPPVAVAAEPARRQSRRAKQGLALRDTPREVQKLHHKHKRDEAQDLLAAAASGEVPKSTSVKKSVCALSSLLFSFGSLEMMRAVLDKFLSLRCVHWLLPEARGQGARQGGRCGDGGGAARDGEAILPCWASRAAKIACGSTQLLFSLVVHRTNSPYGISTPRLQRRRSKYTSTPRSSRSYATHSHSQMLVKVVRL